VHNSGGAVDRIRRVTVLEEGPHGQVFVCVDHVLRRRVIVKHISSGSFPTEEARERMIAEARALACIDHPNLLRIYDYTEKDAHDVFTIEMAEGRPLADALADGIDFARKVQIASAIASALAAAHRNGVVHGALSLQSVVIAKKDLVKLVDFDSTSTNVDGARGDARWASPEESRGEDATRESDMYRFGRLLQELFGAGDRDVRSLTAALLRAAPADRPTAAAALERLERIGQRRARRLRIAAVLLLLAAFALGGTKYTLDLQRERAAALVARARAESARAAANELVAFIVGDLRPKLFSVGKLEIMDAASNKASAYFASIDPRRISAAEAAVNVRALTQFAQTQYLKTDMAAAENAAARAVAVADAAARKYPDDTDVLLGMADAHAAYAEALNRNGDIARAFLHANVNAATCARLVRRRPEDVRLLRSHAIAFGVLAEMYELSGDIDSALRNCEIALTGLRRVIEREDSDESRLEVFNASRRVAMMLVKAGRFYEARERLEHARAEIGEALVREPANIELLGTRAGYDDQLATAALATGDVAAAQRYADAQLAASKQLMAFDQARSRWTRLLLMAHRTAGTAARMNGDLDTALRHHAASIETASALLARNAEPTPLRRENAWSHVELARSLLAAGSPSQALLHAGLAVDILRTMRGSLSAQVVLADALLVRGEALAADGDAAGPATAWDEALRTVESLRFRPPNPQALDIETRVLLRLGRPDRAMPLIRQLSALGYRNREFEALCKVKGAINEQPERRIQP
jgi:tetratricopeptide (TPR) repeat protein/predicted Ser/Thr protein kinase